MMKVFLVEDEVVIREAIHKMIPWREYGFEFVGEAGDGEMALPYVRREKPDLVITDIKMPFMDGLTFAKLIKHDLPDCKILIISGYDDFIYAKQAISLGVEDYLLKPVSKTGLLETLTQIREKFDRENVQKIYYEQFQREIQEYEKNARRDFFELLVGGKIENEKIYEQAERLGIDMIAESYSFVLFTVETQEKEAIGDTYSKETAQIQEQMICFFQGKEQYLLFRNQMFSYAVLVKGTKMDMAQEIKDCVAGLSQVMESEAVDYFICTGKTVERLSQLSESYQAAMHTFARRYIEEEHVIFYETQPVSVKQEMHKLDLNSVDMNAMSTEIIYNFLCSALPDEIDDFVKNYLQMIGSEALKSQMFRQYVVLYVHFSTVDFIRKLGYTKEQLADKTLLAAVQNITTCAQVQEDIKQIIRQGIALRDENAKSRYKSVLNTAVEFMNRHYMDEALTLNTVACTANVSANHFSALFSQQMGETFIEYLTNIRMNKARELLRCTDLRSGEIAMEVGYKDPHYFSFLFKKTVGITPSEYRKGGDACEKKTDKDDDESR